MANSQWAYSNKVVTNITYTPLVYYRCLAMAYIQISTSLVVLIKDLPLETQPFPGNITIKDRGQHHAEGLGNLADDDLYLI